jgi:hypothetical protein
MRGSAGKVQFPKLISYCAPSIIAFLILIEIISSGLPSQLRPGALILPLPLGVLVGAILYFRFAHEVVQYDENGFTYTKGKSASKSYEWNQFADLSLFADPKGGVNVRMYYQPDGEYVDLPATRTGIDPFLLRKALLGRFPRGQRKSESLA